MGIRQSPCSLLGQADRPASVTWTDDFSAAGLGVRVRQSQCKRGVGCWDRRKAWGGWLFMATMLAWVSYKLSDEDTLWGWQLSLLSTPLEPVPFLEPQLAPVCRDAIGRPSA